jgi:hypothetical protein
MSQDSGIAATRLAMLPDRHSPTAAMISGISKPSSTVGTAVSAVAKYVFAEPRYWATASQVMRVTDSAPAVV